MLDQRPGDALDGAAMVEQQRSGLAAGKSEMGVVVPDIRFSAYSGLKSDIVACPAAMKRHPPLFDHSSAR
jgi:hypothetical protein